MVSGALAQQGFTPVLCTQTVGGVSEADYVDLLLQQQVSGVVFAGGLYAQADAPHGHYRRLAERGLPTVLVNASIEGLGFPRVSCDDPVAMDQAMGHLISLGHTQIGLLLGPARPHAVAAQARAGAGRSAAEAGIELGPDRIAHSLYSLEAAQAVGDPAARGRASPASSAPATRWPSARSARCAGRPQRARRRVDRGFDDSALMNCTEPPLTTVRQPIDPMGRMVIELLIGQIAGTPVPHDELLFEPELVVRGVRPGPAPRADRLTPRAAPICAIGVA